MVELEWSFLMSIWRNWKELKTWSDVYSEVFRSNSYQIRGGLCAGEEIIKLAAFVRRDMGWVLQNDEPMEINNFLNIFERFWEILRDFERFWESLRDFERFWEILGDFGRFWEILRDFERFWEIRHLQNGILHLPSWKQETHPSAGEQKLAETIEAEVELSLPY